MKLPSATQATATSLKNAVPKVFVVPNELIEFIHELTLAGKFEGVYRGPGDHEKIRQKLVREGYTAVFVPDGPNETALKVSWNNQARY
jgi:hypothetical protein